MKKANHRHRRVLWPRRSRPNDGSYWGVSLILFGGALGLMIVTGILMRQTWG
jgi:hypothetical protein